MKYLDMMPDVYGDIREFGAIAAAADGAVAELSARIEAAKNGLFLQTAEGGELRRHQRLLDGAARASDDDEAARRRLTALYASPPMYTEQTLLEKLESVCGRGGVELLVDASRSAISAAVSESCGDGDFLLASELLRRASPSALEVRIVRR